MGKKANWHKAKHGLITKAKISFGLQNKKGRAKKNGWGEKKNIEEKKEKEEKKKRREEEMKSKKVWNFGFLYGTMNSCMNFHTIAWLVACPKPRV